MVFIFRLQFPTFRLSSETLFFHFIDTVSTSTFTQELQDTITPLINTNSANGFLKCDSTFTNTDIASDFFQFACQNLQPKQLPSSNSLFFFFFSLKKCIFYSINNTDAPIIALPAFVTYIKTNIDQNSDSKISYNEFKVFYDQNQYSYKAFERAVLEVLYTGLAAKVPDMTKGGSSSTFSSFSSFFFLFLLLLLLLLLLDNWK